MRKDHWREIQNNHKRSNTIKSILLLTLLTVVCFGSWFAYRLLQTHNKIHFPLGMSKLREEQVNIANYEPFSVLLLGIDPLEGEERGRSDTIIIATINPKNNIVRLTSIPRDYRIILPEIESAENSNLYKDKYVKLNAAYAYGGIELAAKAVEAIVDIPIDYYVVINMNGFVALIDAVGGVTVENEFEFSAIGDFIYIFEKGEIHLSGLEALEFSRVRKKIPKGDYGRQQRQRDIITALSKKLMGFQSIKNFDSILGTLGENVTTNLDYQDMWSIAKNDHTGITFLSDTMQGSNEKINGISFEVVSDEERLRIIETLRTDLELPLREQTGRASYDFN